MLRASKLLIMSRVVRHTVLLIALALTACMRWEYGYQEELSLPKNGLYILNEGNFQYGNASLSLYDPTAQRVENDLFYRANAMKLGDVAQSMVVRGDVGWIVVNNSHVVFAVNLDTLKEVGRITNLTSPRYIHFVSDDKAYITQIWDNRIFVVNPKRYEVTGYIEVPNMAMESGSTEQMVQIGDYLYVSCWSYQNRLLKIDTRTDEIVAELQVGVQPSSLVVDCRGKLWTITDGGYNGSPYGYESSALYCVDPDTFTVERCLDFPMGSSPSELQMDGAAEVLYWIDNDIWSMPIDAEALPECPLLDSRGTIYYGLTIEPTTGEIYVADAVDYMQRGKIYRYSAMGELLDEFYVGIIPGGFAWR